MKAFINTPNEKKLRNKPIVGYVDREMKKRVKNWTEKTKYPESELIRRAVTSYLDRQEKKL